jgi:hypothetical protein
MYVLNPVVPSRRPEERSGESMTAEKHRPETLYSHTGMALRRPSRSTHAVDSLDHLVLNFRLGMLAVGDYVPFLPVDGIQLVNAWTWARS